MILPSFRVVGETTEEWFEWSVVGSIGDGIRTIESGGRVVLMRDRFATSLAPVSVRHRNPQPTFPSSSTLKLNFISRALRIIVE